MILFDAETLGKDSTSVILSMAAIQFDPDNKLSYEQYQDSAFFVKLNARDQVERLGRTISKNTIEWWKKQCELVRKQSFIPSPDRDVLAEDAFDQIRKWSVGTKEPKNSWVFARGNLDQLVMDSMEERLGIEPVFFFNRWRDVRTAVDFLTGSTNGYCDVDYEGFSPSKVIKHCPINDCAYDIMMILYGKSSE